MLKVFLADDEACMRAGIRNNLDWDNSPYTLAGEAPDGELALSLMCEIMPDILITDVRMPFMDGIELSRQAKKAMPWIKIIILSGHDEFEYAKQAISIGVEEYLLKPVTSQLLKDTLSKVAARIEGERESLKNMERLLSDNRRKEAEGLLSELLYGGADAADVIGRAGGLKHIFEANYYIVMIFEFRAAADEGYGPVRAARARAAGVLDGWENAVSLNEGADRIICVLTGQDEAALEEESFICAQAVKREAERGLGCCLFVAIGAIVTRVDDWPKSLSDADMARRCLNMTDGKRIISSRDIKGGALSPFKEMSKLPTTDKLRFASKEDISRFLDESFGGVAGSPPMASFMFLNYIYVDILMAACKMVEELGGDADALVNDLADMAGLLPDADIETARRSLAAVLERAIDFRDSCAVSKYAAVISRAREYINNNFSRHSISLNSVASEVNMSPNHFSTIFSQETGETFIGCITRIRLEQAKKLLKTTNMRASDIGYAVGYNDTHYFSYVFKKNTGMSPKEFRK